MVKTYSYLLAGLAALLLVIALSTGLVSRDQRRYIFLAGLIGTLSFPLLVLFEGHYWSPRRLGGWMLGVEDVIVSYVVAALAWLVAILPFKQRMEINFTLPGFIVKYLIIGAFAGNIFLWACLWGVNPMSSLILTQAVLFVLLVFLRPRLLWLSLVGVIGFPATYCALVKVYLLVWPDAISHWNEGHFWGRRVWGVPWGELTWSIGHGAFWPMFVGYVFDARLIPAEIGARSAMLERELD